MARTRQFLPVHLAGLDRQDLGRLLQEGLDVGQYNRVPVLLLSIFGWRKSSCAGQLLRVKQEYSYVIRSSVSHPTSTTSKSATGQTFRAPNNGVSYYLRSVKFYLYREDTPTGTCKAVLYAHSGTYGSSGVPTGSPLATSSDIQISSIPTSWDLLEFTFPEGQQYQMSPDTPYAITIQWYMTADGSSGYGYDLDTISSQGTGNDFYYSSSAWHYDSGGSMVTIGSSWIQRFATPVLGSNSLTCSSSNENQKLYVQNDYYGRLQGYGLLDLQLYQGKSIDISKTYNGYGIGSVLNLLKYNASTGTMDKWINEGATNWATEFDTQDGYNGGVMTSPGSGDAKVSPSSMSNVANSMTDFNIKQVGSGSQDWWIAVRHSASTGNDYFEWTSGSSTLYLQKHLGGGTYAITSASLPTSTFTADQWHGVMVKVFNHDSQVTLQFYFGGSLILEKTDQPYDSNIARVIQLRANGGHIHIDNPRVFSIGATNNFEFFDDFEYKEMGLFLLAFTKPGYQYSSQEAPGYFAFCGAWGSDYTVGKAAMTCAAWPKISTLAVNIYDTSNEFFVQTISWTYCYQDGFPRVGFVHSIIGADKAVAVTNAWAPCVVTTNLNRITMQVMKGEGCGTKIKDLTQNWNFLTKVQGLTLPLFLISAPAGTSVISYGLTVAMNVISLSLSSSTADYGTSISVQWNDIPSSGNQFDLGGEYEPTLFTATRKCLLSTATNMFSAVQLINGVNKFPCHSVLLWRVSEIKCLSFFYFMEKHLVGSEQVWNLSRLIQKRRNFWK